MKNLSFSAATVSLLTTQKGKPKAPDTDALLNKYSSRYYESRGCWEIVTTWFDDEGKKQVLQTLKKQEHLVTLFNNKQLFIHGFSATYNHVKRHHEWVRKQIMQQIKYA